GMFIHWGLYSTTAKGEWLRHYEDLSIEDYHSMMGGWENFAAENYDPRAWAKTAKNAGMKYAILTAKHHDGFCLFDSKLTDYKATNTKAGRDLIREYLEAFRAEGLKVGLYYSLLDWHHPDFPHYGEKYHPMRKNEAFKDYNYDFNRYLEYMHGQIEELCTNYGKIDLFWFDFSYEEMSGEKWEATKLIRMIRSHQPDVIIDNRLEASGEGYGSLLEECPSEYAGDYVSPEQIIPPNGLRGKNGEPLVWEACVTLNNNWGYNASDNNWKPADMVIKKLVECVSKGGNMLLNVGPKADGTIPEESLKILESVGKWMDANHDSIYGCTLAQIDKPEFGRITYNPVKNALYYHVMENQVGAVPLAGIQKEKIGGLRLLTNNKPMELADYWPAHNYPDLAFIIFGESPVLPDLSDTVVEVTLKK
ncbi:MAG: alpha-L-fucosidase, partial [Defluviitaleaceae bacterium]|nr:alpha-L-fucosidase [Defluviitaleaceae bacterium]